MPTMANITVKNAAGADVLYSASVPSAGDKTPARWTALAASSIAGFRPTITLGTRDNGSRNARVVEVNYSFPITETVSGVETRVGSVTFKGTATMPTNVSSAKANDGYVQCSHLLSSALFKASADEGFAPT